MWCLLGQKCHWHHRHQAEYEHYGELAAERAQRLSALRRSAQATEQKLSDLQRDEARLTDVLAALERARRGSRGARGGLPVPGSITTADIGKLDWPVDGKIVYRFGRDTLPSGGIIRWNGIGIAVGRGTPVKSVAPGTVRLARSLGTYGPSVVIDHGGGYYTVYCFLDEIQVRENQQIAKGDVVGLSGGENSDQGPHIEFQVRKEGQALDPIAWLRRRQ